MPRNEKEVKMFLSGRGCKTTCKILGIFAKIGEILSIIAAVSLAVAGVFLGANHGSMDINQIVKEAESEAITSGESIVTISGSAVEEFLAKGHSEQVSIILVGIALGVAALVFMSILAKYIYRLFKNLEHGRTPFTMENVDIIQNVAKWLFIDLITLDLASLVLSLMVVEGTVGVNISLSHYALGFVLLVLAVIFRHGCELEKKTKN